MGASASTPKDEPPAEKSPRKCFGLGGGGNEISTVAEDECADDGLPGALNVRRGSGGGDGTASAGVGSQAMSRVSSVAPEDREEAKAIVQKTYSVGYQRNMKLESAKAILEECDRRWISPIKLFEDIDTDNDGEVQIEEMQDAIKARGIDVDVTYVFISMDMDNSGTISKGEFLDFLREADKARLAKHLRKLRTQETRLLSDIPAEKGATGLVKNARDGYIALVAHNEMKGVMAGFVEEHVDLFKQLKIVTTGTTGKSLEGKLGIEVGLKVASGPMGGDAEIGELITQGEVAGVFFFKDPLSPQPHAADIEALTRVCDVHQVPYATNASSGFALALCLELCGIDEWCGMVSQADSMERVASNRAASKGTQARRASQRRLSAEGLAPKDPAIEQAALVAARQLLKYCRARWMNPVEMFNLVDADGSGYVDCDEFMEIAAKLRVHTDFQALFEHIDDSGDGQVESGEFTAFMAKVEKDFTADDEYVSPMKARLDGVKLAGAGSDKLVVLMCQDDTLNVLVRFVEAHQEILRQCKFACSSIATDILRKKFGLDIKKSIIVDKVGGSQVAGALVTRGDVAALFFFKDALKPFAAATDIIALTRLCDVHQVPYATNASASLCLVLALGVWGLNCWYAPSEEGAVAAYKANQQRALERVIAGNAP